LIEKKTKFLEMKEKTKIAESILRYKFNWNFKNTINKKKIVLHMK
jgi:hypothetical protein